MSLAPGSRLGPYEILAPLGAGGMGEVYRARDTRLDRTVAIKVLPSHLAKDATLRERFEREARAVSSLNHPHICALYDIGRYEGVDFLVMEHIEGETLAARLTKGPLPTEQALRFAVQIADALDKAHRQGVVHRDLKPGNIMLTKAGAKLLDFGLAKLRPADPAGSVPGSSALLTKHADLTAEGSIVGTLQYMAPEQLEGKEADSRTDIFSFGAVLHEMITGRKAFEGNSQASIIGAILHTEPQPVSAIQPMTPPALDRAVKNCLAKDPDERWQSASDLTAELKWIAEGGSQAGMPAAPTARRFRPREFLTGTLAGLVFGIVAASLAYFMFEGVPPQAPGRASRFSLTIPPNAPLALYGARNIALSPDGRWLAYVAEGQGFRQVFVRPIDRLDAAPLTGTDGGVSLFFSPDSHWLGFASGSKLKKVPIAGGAVETICDATEVRGASWGANGTIVFAVGTAGMRRVPASGGTPEKVTTPEMGESMQYGPQILPGDDTVLFTTLDARGSYIKRLSLKTGEAHVILEGSQARYSSTGHLLFMRADTLMIAPFDLSRAETTGPATSLEENVLKLPGLDLALFDVSNEGTLIYAPAGRMGVTQSLVLVDRQGKASPLPLPSRTYEEPRLSPDGRRFAAALRERNADIWIGETSRGTLTRLTFDEAEDETPIWTPDGRRVTYASGKVGQPRGAFWKPADGSGMEEQIFPGDNHPHVSSWSADGKALAYTDYDGSSLGDIWTFRPDGQPAKTPFLKTPFNERAARFSPSGAWLVYVSDETGRDEIYVQAYPRPGGKWQISNEGGTEPVWSRDGREIFYRWGDKMMAVSVTTQPTFSADAPHLLFTGRYLLTRRGEAAYDVGPDGRFLMVRREQESLATELTVVVNWPAELQHQAPTGPSP